MNLTTKKILLVALLCAGQTMQPFSFNPFNWTKKDVSSVAKCIARCALYYVGLRGLAAIRRKNTSPLWSLGVASAAAFIPFLYKKVKKTLHRQKLERDLEQKISVLSEWFKNNNIVNALQVGSSNLFNKIKELNLLYLEEKKSLQSNDYKNLKNLREKYQEICPIFFASERQNIDGKKTENKKELDCENTVNKIDTSKNNFYYFFSGTNFSFQDMRIIALLAKKGSVNVNVRVIENSYPKENLNAKAQKIDRETQIALVRSFITGTLKNSGTTSTIQLNSINSDNYNDGAVITAPNTSKTTINTISKKFASKTIHVFENYTLVEKKNLKNNSK